jgi:hypothetical protein
MAAALLAADGAVARRALAVLEPPLQEPVARPGGRDRKADALAWTARTIAAPPPAVWIEIRSAA